LCQDFRFPSPVAYACVILTAILMKRETVEIQFVKLRGAG